MADDPQPENARMEIIAKHLKIYAVTTERNHGNISGGYNKALEKVRVMAKTLTAEPVTSKGEA